MSEAAPLRVLLWGTYDLGKPRTRILRDGLRAIGAQVTEIHGDVWSRHADKSQAGKGALVRVALRTLLLYPVLAARYLAAPKHDVVLVPYLGQLDVLVLWPFAKLRRRPVVLDMFLSLTDTVVHDRRMAKPGSPVARALGALEWLSCRAADRVVMDTKAHAAYVAELFDLPASRVAAVPVGAEAGAFPRLPAPEPRDGPARVLFYGQLIPLHGVETILAAALSERGRAHRWHLVGTGQMRPLLEEALSGDDAPHVTWDDWIEYPDLVRAIEASDVCLGIFGPSRKAASVVPNKVYQALMAGRSVITRASPAIDETFPDAPGLARVPAGDPDALLDAIDAMKAQGFPVLPEAALDLARPEDIARRLERDVMRPLTERETRPMFVDRSLLDDAPSGPAVIHHPRFGPASPEGNWVPAPRYLLRRDRVMAHLADVAPCRVLDIGCGPAVLLSELAARGFEAHGVDYSQGALALAKAFSGPDRRMDLRENLDPAWKGSFDMILSFEVIEHLEEDVAAMTEWLDYLKPGGRMILSTPAHPERFNAADVWAGHVRRYTRPGLTEAIESAGYEIETMECYGFPLANVMERLRAYAYGRVLAKTEKAGMSVQDLTEDSGTDRGVESRFWKVFASAPSSVAMGLACRAQRPFLGTDLGNGYLVVARKP